MVYFYVELWDLDHFNKTETLVASTYYQNGYANFNSVTAENIKFVYKSKTPFVKIFKNKDKYTDSDLHSETQIVNHTSSQELFDNGNTYPNIVTKPLIRWDDIVPPVKLGYSFDLFGLPRQLQIWCSNQTPKTGYTNRQAYIHLKYMDSNDPDIILHEFGHFYMDVKTGLNITSGTHYWNQSSSITVAFSEGWATFFSCYMLNNPLFNDNGDIENVTFTPTVPDGNQWEAAVAAALWDITDGNIESHDNMNLGITEIRSIVDNMSVSSVDDFVLNWKIAGYPNAESIFENYGIEYSVQINSNQTWQGMKVFYNNVTIGAGVTVTVAEGTEINLENASALKVYGTLNINGTSSNRVTIDGGNGIMVYNGSNVNINYTEIKNTLYGVYVDNASPTITNCLIQNNSFGMLVQNYGSPTLSYNTIRNNTMEGIFCMNHGHVDLFPGHNLITNNGSGGIFLNYQSSSYAGYVSGPGFNSIYSNTSYEFEAKVVSSANLKTVYWGTGNAPVSSEYSVDAGSSYNFSDYFSSNPGAGSSLSKTSYEATDFDLANNLYAKGNYKEAEKLYKKVIKENGKETISQFALEGLNRCYIKEKKKGIKDYLKTELTSKYKTSKDEFEVQTLELDAYWSLQEGDVDAAIKTYDYILENFSNDKEVVEMTLYNKGKTYVDYLGDKETAENVFSELKTRDSKSILVALSDEALKGDTKLNNKSFLEKEDDLEFEEETVVSSFELFENYPNPFNPTTTISYQIPEAGFVTLKVYDMLGKEVANLIEGRNDAGKYNVNFDASKLASGIYVYRITVQSFEGSQKNFTKSAKMLLLK